MKTVFVVKLAGHNLRYSFLNSGTLLYFKNYISISESRKYDIRMSEERFEECRKLVPADRTDAYTEHKGLGPLTSKKLLEYNCCLYHGVAVRFMEKAWILTAPSGTGKTTQYLNWKELYHDDVEMICGDMPVLEHNNGMIIVHYSPWNGKECIGSHLSAPLGGIIILSQEIKNQIVKTTAEESVFDIINQFIVIPEDEKEIRTVFAMIDCIFKNYPVWHFGNTGSLRSTEMLVEQVKTEVKCKR